MTRPTYLNRYPKFDGFMEGQPLKKRRNYAMNNIFVRSELPPTESREVDSTNLTLDTDDIFIDPAAGDYTIRPDAEIFKQLPNFEPIPFRQIGVVAPVGAL